MRARIACLMILGAVAIACNQTGMAGQPQPEPQVQAPPLTQVTVSETRTVITGRMWVLPNPIRIRPGWAAPAGGDGQPVAVDIVNIGSENLYVDNIYITGSTDFVMPDPAAGWGLPVPIAFEDCCTAENGVTFPLDYRPDGGPVEVGRLVLETSDPTSPGYTVPIIFDPTGDLTPDDPFEPPHGVDSHLLVKPDPIRFTGVAVGSSQDIGLCVHPASLNPPVVTDIRVSGDGLSMRTGPGELDVVITYAPGREGEMDGSLSFDFTDSWGDDFTLVVPVLVR